MRRFGMMAVAVDDEGTAENRATCTLYSSIVVGRNSPPVRVNLSVVAGTGRASSDAAR
ncbi:MAG: hypothetical protein V2A73_18295 [Pseudomonadota bacterium]